eukprot:1726681-Amphidinium_carterae.1
MEIAQTRTGPFGTAAHLCNASSCHIFITTLPMVNQACLVWVDMCYQPISMLRSEGTCGPKDAAWPELTGVTSVGCVKT